MPATNTVPATVGASRTKTVCYTAAVVLSNVAGNSALSKGLDLAGGTGNSPLGMIAVLFHPWVAAGVALLIVWTLLHMAMLSWADLSFVLPVTSIGYVLTALSGKFLLGETVSPMRWFGIALITFGVIIVGRTTPVSFQENAPDKARL